MAIISIGKKDIVWSYLGNFLRLAANIILLPFMLHYLSDEDLGLWYVFATIAHIAVLIDFGFAPALSRNISYIWCGAKELKKEDVSENTEGTTDVVTFKRILMTCRYMYQALSIIVFLLLFSIGTYYIVSLNSSSDNVLVSWIIYGLGVVLNLYYSYFTSFLRGVGAIAENNIAGVISRVLQIVISCFLLYFGWGLLGASVGYFASGIILRLYSKLAFYKYDNIGLMLNDTKVYISFKECWDSFVIIWHNASKEGLIMISNFLTSQANTLICSSVLGLATTGSYGISLQIITVICGLAGIPYSTYQPKMLEKIVKNDNHSSLKIFSGSFLLFVIVYFLLSIGVLSSVPLIKLLKPTYSMNYPLMTIMLLYMAIDQIYHLFASYISNYNKLPYTEAFVLSSICSVLFSYLLANYTGMGIWALIIAPLVVALIYNAWRWPLYVLKDNSTQIVTFVQLGVIALNETRKKIKI